MAVLLALLVALAGLASPDLVQGGGPLGAPAANDLGSGGPPGARASTNFTQGGPPGAPVANDSNGGGPPAHSRGSSDDISASAPPG